MAAPQNVDENCWRVTDTRSTYSRRHRSLARRRSKPVTDAGRRSPFIAMGADHADANRAVKSDWCWLIKLRTRRCRTNAHRCCCAVRSLFCHTGIRPTARQPGARDALFGEWLQTCLARFSDWHPRHSASVSNSSVAAIAAEAIITELTAMRVVAFRTTRQR